MIRPHPEPIADVRFRRTVKDLHDKGPRALAELLAEIGASFHCMTAVERCAERYAALDDAALAATGGDRFPPLPIHKVRT